MIAVEQIRQEMHDEFDRAGLLPFLIEDSSQILDLGDELFAEIVLSDATKHDEATELISQLLKAQGRRIYTFVVRSQWIISQIGNLTPAYGQDGGLRAAILIPVTLKSGSEQVVVTVAVTKLAEMELDRILGHKADLKQTAKLVIEGKLRRGGRSFWDPTIENYLEVASGAAPDISRLLRQSAQ